MNYQTAGFVYDEKDIVPKQGCIIWERIKQSIVNDASQKQKDITPELEVQLAEHIGMVVGLLASKQSETLALLQQEKTIGLLAWNKSLEN